MVASRLIKREKSSLPVDVRRSKTSLLKLPNDCSYNVQWRDGTPYTNTQITILVNSNFVFGSAVLDNA